MDYPAIGRVPRSYTVAAILLAAFFALLVGSSINDSATFDEVAHIPAGYTYLALQDMRINPEHPPLIKDLAALPLLFLNLNFSTDPSFWNIENVNDRQWLAGNALLYQFGNDPDQILLWSRFSLMLLSVAFGILLFWWTRKYFGAATGLLTLFLYVASPTVIAHSRLVTTDIGAAFGFFVGMIMLFYFLRNRTTKSAVLFGVVLGIIQLCKFSLVLMIPISVVVGILWIWLHNGQNTSSKIFLAPLRKKSELNSTMARARPKILSEVFRSCLALFIQLIIAGIVALVVIWVVYAFHVWNYPQKQQIADMHYILDGYKVPIVTNIVFALAEHPITRSLAQYFYGFLMVAQRTAGGNTAYFWGEISSKGWISYFPTLLFIKEQVALYIFAIIALCYGLARSLRAAFSQNIYIFIAIVFIVFYFIWSIASPLNIGVRHALPILPFMYIVIAYGTVRWIQDKKNVYPFTAWGTMYRLYEKYIKPVPRYVVVGTLVLWMAIETGTTFPYFLSYYNIMGGGTSEGYRIATDSNYDWGQDLKRLRDWTIQNGAPVIYLDYFGGGSPSYYLGDAYRGWWSSRGAPLTPNSIEGQPIYYAVSLNTLMGAWGKTTGDITIKKEDSYEWLRGKIPIARAGTSIMIFKINQP